MLFNDIYLWLHEGPRPVAVAEEPQLVRGVMVAEPPADSARAPPPVGYSKPKPRTPPAKGLAVALPTIFFESAPQVAVKFDSFSSSPLSCS